jgi:hypothetical protein
MEGEQSRSRRLSLKRPWEDVTLLAEGRHSTIPTSIDPVAYRRPSLPLSGVFTNNRHGPENRESVVKKAKFEGFAYNTFSQNFLDVGSLNPRPEVCKYD